MTDKEELVNDILEEVYQEANPGVDVDDVRGVLTDQPDDWYDRHFLPMDEQKEIINRHIDNADLNEEEETSVFMTCLLGYGPSSTPVRKEDEEAVS